MGLYFYISTVFQQISSRKFSNYIQKYHMTSDIKTILILLIIFQAVTPNQFVFTTQIGSSYDDVYQSQRGAVIDQLPVLEHKSGTVAAYRFQVYVPNNSILQEVRLMLRYNWGTGPAILQIAVQDSSNSQTIQYQPYSISNRKFLPLSIKFGAAQSNYGSEIISPDIKNLVKPIIQSAQWKPGNSLLLTVSNFESNTTLQSISYEGTPFHPGKYSAELYIRYQNSQQNLKREPQNRADAFEQAHNFLQTQRQKCHKQTLSEKLPVLFTIDDLQTKYLQLISNEIISLHLEEQVDILLNVIPNQMNSSLLLRYTLEYWLKAYPCLIEIGQHGYTHQGDEYNMNSLSYPQQMQIITKGQQQLQKVGLVTKSFTPPGGRQNYFTFKILDQLGFHTSVDWYRKAEGLETSSILLFENQFLCEDSNGQLLGPSCKIKDSKTLEAEIDEQIKRLGYSMISFHIQDFSQYNGQLDQTKLNKYKEILKDLKQTKKYEFMLPEEYHKFRHDLT